MVDTKKEQEREELHRAIWAIADELRGAVDGWDFKNYVLGTMFYRYISENLCNYINNGEIDAGNTDFDFAKMPDEDAEEARAGLVEEKGFFILPSELFCNVRAKAVNDENLNETLERVFRHIEESAKGSEAESDFAGLFDDYDVNSNKLGSTVAKRNEKLVKLLNGVGEMNLGDVKDHSIDAFGDAYEYLMTMYASNAGKSGGEFFTPADVSELLTRLGTVGKTEINKVYDPACGSGSLLLKAEKILGKDAIRNGFYGQEINITTYNLCRINMFLHDVGFDKFDIACEDTLLSPQHWDDEPFELIVSNPPYSIKWAGDENPLLINDPRFAPAGVLAPKSKADMAFIMHSLSWLASNGTAAIVCFPGIMYRGGAEQKSRAGRLPESLGTGGMAQRAGEAPAAYALQAACQAGGILEDRPPAAGVPGSGMGEVGGALLLHGCAGDDLETEKAALPDGADGQLQRLSAAVEPQGQKAVVSGHRA